MIRSRQCMTLPHLRCSRVEHSSLVAGSKGSARMLYYCRRVSGSIISFSARAARTNSSLMQSGGTEWKGLGAWRDGPVEERRVWGKHGPAIESIEVPQQAIEREQLCEGKRHELVAADELAKWGTLVLATADPLEKAWLTHQAFRLWKSGLLQVGTAAAPDVPGRPLKPDLVHPRQVPSPKDSNLSPSAHMLHNLAHIELNAIDLAWDTVVRFSYASDELGREFFGDFLHVADDESRHFRWCSQRLNELGASYGDMPAHNLLWKDCMKTAGSVKSRLAVIPMMQEARGLDAGPRLVKRLLGLNDHRSAGIVRRIGQEEVAHVGVGVFHFLRVCEKLDVNPGNEFRELMVECNIELQGPFNHKARALAGFERDWYESAELSQEVKTKEVNTPQSTVVKKHTAQVARDTVGKELPAPEQNSKPSTLKTDETPKTLDQSALSKLKGDSNPETSTSDSPSSVLPEVFERLVLVVAMERENSST